MPTRILVAIRSTLDTGVSGLKYQPLVPESTMTVLIRALSFAALVMATCRVARCCSHLAFHLVFKDAARWIVGGRGSTDAATRIFGAGGRNYREIMLSQ